MRILGINSVYHESAAALVVDGRTVVAVEEERLNRHKHGKPAAVDTPHILPTESIAFCLKHSGLRPADIDCIAYSFDPARRAEEFTFDAAAPVGDWGSPAGEDRFRGLVAKVPDVLSDVFDLDIRERFRWVRHHLAHAASVFYPSGFEEAAILVIDGIAENASTTFAAGDGPVIRWLRDVHYPDSLGFLWEKLAQYLGFSEYDAAKVMGMAAWGDPRRQRAAFNRFAQVTADGFALDGQLLNIRGPGFEALESVLGPRRLPDEPLAARHFDIAAALQAFTTEAVLALLHDLHHACPSENLCIAGGVGLNCVTNTVVLETGPFRRLFLPPAPHDAGTAIGAALYVHYADGDHDDARHAGARDVRPPEPQLNPYLGPAYDDGEIVAALDRAGLASNWLDDPAEEAAGLIAAGRIVGWFAGALEFGPRALGHRSLLADPRSPHMRHVINSKVKHREPFRPFAGSILEERLADWFEAEWSDGLLYMLFAVPARPDKASAIPAVLHEDKTCRLQAVRRSLSPTYHRLIGAFERLTGVPLVLNTSFNDQEPIVCSPADAIATFLKTEIDVLFLENRLVTGKDRDALRRSRP